MLERLGWGMERDKLLQLFTPVTFLRFPLSRPWGLFSLHCGPRSFPAGCRGLGGGAEQRGKWEGGERGSAKAIALSGMDRQRLRDNVPLSLYVDGTASH